MSSATKKIPSTDEAWDSGELGEDFGHAEVLKENIDADIDEALELQSISIRLQKSLIEDFKYIAQLDGKGLGYQPLMRQVLARFADCEKKRILREKVSEVKEEARKAKAEEKEELRKKVA